MKKLRQKKVRNIIIIAESILLAVLLLSAVLIGTKMSKIERIELEPETLVISISDEVEHKEEYLNVAIFGLDSRKGDLGKGNRSDTILIASLNQKTKEVKMVSVYRDTLLRLKDGSYNKANAAYAFYGPDGAVQLLNENLDLNIDKYISVNFNALVDVIDALGGMELTLTYEEVVHMNNYCVETSEVTGKSYERIEPEEAGTYHLNGVQAVSYSRIRYTAGGDAKRTERQRLVIGKIMEKAQNMNLSMINNLVDSVFPQVATNFTLGEILSYAKDFKRYQIGESIGFPAERTSERIDGVGISEIPNTLQSNVTGVHQFLFNDMEYQPSSKIQEIEKGLKQ